MPIANSTYTEIGAFEAKTKLSEVLRKVEQGERFTITVRGGRWRTWCPRGRLVSARLPRRSRRPTSAQASEDRRVSHEQIRAWIEEGRP